MTQLDMIVDTIAKLEATVDKANAPLHEPIKPAEKQDARNRSKSTSATSLPKRKSTKAPQSKKAVLQSLVERKHGATLQAMMDATGWQAHSVRSGLTGLRKAGVTLERRANRKGETVYTARQTQPVQ